jgi:hypothetical protein
MNIRNMLGKIRQYIAPPKPLTLPAIERVEPNAIATNAPTPRKASFRRSTAKRAIDKRKAKAKRKEAQKTRRMNRRRGK